jgi:hypothetical protein
VDNSAPSWDGWRVTGPLDRISLRLAGSRRCRPRGVCQAPVAPLGHAHGAGEQTTRGPPGVQLDRQATCRVATLRRFPEFLPSTPGPLAPRPDPGGIRASPGTIGPIFAARRQRQHCNPGAARIRILGLARFLDPCDDRSWAAPARLPAGRAAVHPGAIGALEAGDSMTLAFLPTTAFSHASQDPRIHTSPAD